MKNFRSTLTLTIIGVLILTGGLGTMRWYYAGQRPPGPKDFLSIQELHRTRERILAFRLDLRPALVLCDDVNLHVEKATSIQFTNPQQTKMDVRKLFNELSEIEWQHEETIRDLEAGREGTWRTPFREFIETSKNAYEDGIRLSEILARTDWRDQSFQSLLTTVVEAKDLCGALQIFPPFSNATELRLAYYPHFERAYRSREESDLSRIHTHLLPPQPSLTRWFYARLYQSHSIVPENRCVESLLTTRDRLRSLAQEIHTSDIQHILHTWDFLTGRATHLDRFAKLSAPLEQASTLTEWLTIMENNSTSWKSFTEQTRLDAEVPDPELRRSANILLETEGVLQSQISHLKNHPTLDMVKTFDAVLARLLNTHSDLSRCPLQVVHMARNQCVQFQHHVAEFSNKVPESSATVVATLSEFRSAATAMSNTIGEPIEMSLIQDALDRWLSEKWPDVRNLNQLATGLRVAVNRGIVDDPAALRESARFMDRISMAQSAKDREQLGQEWAVEQKEIMIAYPRISRRIQWSLQSLEEINTRENLSHAIQLGEELRLRSLAHRVLTRHTELSWLELQTAATDILKILDLSLHLHEFDVSDLPSFRTKNALFLPDPPDTDSLVAPLYAERVQPILTLADAIAFFQTMNASNLWETENGCTTKMTEGINSSHVLRSLYPHWDGLDQLFVLSSTAAFAHCLSLDVDELEWLANSYEELASIDRGFAGEYDRPMALAEAAHALSKLLQTDIEHPNFLLLLEKTQSRFGEHPTLNEDIQSYLNVCETLIAFHHIVRTKNSFLRFRQAISELQHAPKTTPVTSQLMKTLHDYLRGIDILKPLVDMDMQLIYKSGVSSLVIEQLAERYRRAGMDSNLPRPMAKYAQAQAHVLRHYLSSTNYVIRPLDPASEPHHRSRIRYDVLRPPLHSLGFGKRFKGRGNDLEVWIRSGTNTQSILFADWKDREADGYIELDDVKRTKGVVSWQWGFPITVGIRVAHTTNENRDLIPDSVSGRSRWDPRQYGLYRLQTNEFHVATFPNLEAMYRKLGQTYSSSTSSPPAQFDTLLDPERHSENPYQLLYIFEGISTDRDFDWPLPTETENASDSKLLGRELRNIASNFFDRVLQPRIP